jgi:hypothetical protein
MVFVGTANGAYNRRLEIDFIETGRAFRRSSANDDAVNGHAHPYKTSLFFRDNQKLSFAKSKDSKLKRAVQSGREGD